MESFLNILRASLIVAVGGALIVQALDRFSDENLEWEQLENMVHRLHQKKHSEIDGFKSSAGSFPFQDPTLPWDQRVDDLVGRLTLEEIVPQTEAVYGGQTPEIPRLNIKPYIWISECLHGQVGSNTTAFPQAIGLAASFSEELLYNVSEAISFEVRAHWNGYRKQGQYITGYGLSCFSPVINIMRHPLWGRNQESYGEDPYLAGKLVQGFVRGLQGNHPRYVRANAGCKHYDVHGGPENIPVERFSFDAKVSMANWRMTFLPQFKMCVDAGTYSLMCSYNSVNGIPACAHELLLTNITRQEWGFKGYVVSDAGAISNIISRHKYLKTNQETAAACIKAGCNLELASTVFGSQLDAMKAGLVTEKQLRDNIRPLMYTRLRLGEFDPEDMNPYNDINMAVVQSPEHRQLAVTAAMKSFVLLKNTNNFLPLTKTYQRLAIVGPFVTATDQLFGDYSSNIIANFTSTLPNGLSKLAKTVATAAGCPKTSCDNYSPSDVIQAVTGADLVVVALGLGQDLEAEGNDRSSLDLPGQQLELLLDVVSNANSDTPVILLLFNAGPLDITWAKLNPAVTSILECFYPGQSAGEAIYNVLTATGGPSAVPAGRLPATWPSFLKQVPPITDYNMADHTYRYYNGYPLYPFGYGLSYTSFLYTSVTLSNSTISGGQNITATIGVLNTGKWAADEVIQVYVIWPEVSTNIPIPKVQLVAFTRQEFSAGEHRLVELLINPERYAVWGDSGWTFIKGKMLVFVGGQQPDQETHADSNVLQTSFTVV